MFAAFHANACSCMEVSLDKNYTNSDYVIIAKAIKVDETHQYPESKSIKGMIHGFKSVFQIIKVYKGEIISDTIEVDSGFSTCSVEFIQGETYIIFGIRKNEFYFTNMCDRTRSAALSPDIEVLNRR